MVTRGITSKSEKLIIFHVSLLFIFVTDHGTLNQNIHPDDVDIAKLNIITCVFVSIFDGYSSELFK